MAARTIEQRLEQLEANRVYVRSQLVDARAASAESFEILRGVAEPILEELEDEIARLSLRSHERRVASAAVPKLSPIAVTPAPRARARAIVVDAPIASSEKPAAPRPPMIGYFALPLPRAHAPKTYARDSELEFTVWNGREFVEDTRRRR
jgi:hypothetical protein